MDAVRDIFYDAHCDDKQSTTVDDLLQCVDFHALSITLLATVTSSHSAWDFEKLTKEWVIHHTQVLRTDYNGILVDAPCIFLNNLSSLDYMFMYLLQNIGTVMLTFANNNQTRNS